MTSKKSHLKPALIHWQRIVLDELKGIFFNRAVLLLVFGGVLFYAFLYPMPYAHQVAQKQKVAVVNLDNSKLSHQLEQMVNATPEIQLSERVASVDKAKNLLFEKEIAGFFIIPTHFSERLIKGIGTEIPIFGNGGYFLTYSTISNGMIQAISSLVSQSKHKPIMTQEKSLTSTSTTDTAFQLQLFPVFNPSMGYLNYVLPAVFLLTLQQTLIMGIGLVSKAHKPTSKRSLFLAHLLIRVLLFVLIYLLASLYYYGICMPANDILLQGSGNQTLLLLLPFLLSSCFIGLLLSWLLPRAEIILLVVLASSLPLIFSAGFIWPVEAIPAPIVWISRLFPCTLMIKANEMLNQFGASWQDCASLWLGLWGQTIGWGGLCVAGALRQITRG